MQEVFQNTNSFERVLKLGIEGLGGLEGLLTDCHYYG
jgi:hypothetical protein